MNDEDAVLFFQDIELLVEHADEIIERPEYFHCPLAFAYCGWPYVGGGGPLAVGHLLIGWREGYLIDECSRCGGALLIFRFAGSPLSGGNWHRGFCRSCARTDRGSAPLFGPRFRAMYVLTSRHTNEIKEWHEVDAECFSWGGSGLQPCRRKIQTKRRLVEPVSLDELLAKLRSGG